MLRDKKEISESDRRLRRLVNSSSVKSQSQCGRERFLALALPRAKAQKRRRVNGNFLTWRCWGRYTHTFDGFLN